jgi:catechol 2,3-dioxygenase-like lactoylglutathione lyase family enzyme
MMKLSRLDHFAVTVKDLQVSADWYQRVFGFEVIHRFTHTWMVGNPHMKVGLMHAADATPVPDLDKHIAFQHVAFLTDRDGFEAAQIFLKSAGVEYDGPEDTGIAFSLFFNDPDGHLLEITTYHKVD